jgi:hypothetical protein
MTIVVPTTNPVRVLRNAADYLEANGWTQDEFFQTKYETVVCDGEPEEFPTGQPPAACALGAIQIAVTGEPIDVFADGYKTSKATDDQIRLVMDVADLVVSHLRREHNTAQLATWNTTDVLAKWNDRDGRTAAEVIAAMREAADRHQNTGTTPRNVAEGGDGR